MYQALSSAGNPCAGVTCGAYGTCFNGSCSCNHASGYTGIACNVAPAPIDGVLTAWLSHTECVPRCRCGPDCNMGLRSASRTCLPPLFGGAPCNDSAPLIKSETCTLPAVNAGAGDVGDCGTAGASAAVAGGYSAWSAWSACSNACPVGVGGFFVGQRVRTRTCDNPLPSSLNQSCESRGLGLATMAGAVIGLILPVCWCGLPVRVCVT